MTTDDALTTVLRLVSEGRLTAEEAAPILDALDATGDQTPPAADPRPADVAPVSPNGGPGRALRVEVVEDGRKVVNLRVPLALGQAALARIPGLSQSTADLIREIVATGASGPIVAVDDADGGVRIVIE